MMKFALSLLLLAFVASAIAADPALPAWPLYFSASIHVVDSKMPQPEFYRYFYDSHSGFDRTDMLRVVGYELYFFQVIEDFRKGEHYDLIFEDDVATCLKEPLESHKIPIPDFSKFTYMGTSVIFYRNCYHWTFEDKEAQALVEFYDTADANRDPVRWVFSSQTDDSVVRYDYFEFDTGVQNEALFEIPEVLKNLCDKPPL